MRAGQGRALTSSHESLLNRAEHACDPHVLGISPAIPPATLHLHLHLHAYRGPPATLHLHLHAYKGPPATLHLQPQGSSSPLAPTCSLLCIIRLIPPQQVLVLLRRRKGQASSPLASLALPLLRVRPTLLLLLLLTLTPSLLAPPR